MSLKERLENDMKSAMKARDSFRSGALRFVLAQVKNREIDLRKPATDEDVCKIVQTLVKQRRESAEFSQKAGRADLVEKEMAELALLQSYLPEMMSDEEMGLIVDTVIGELNAAGPQDMGRVMKAVMPKLAGRADGSKINELVKKRLQPR